MLPPGATPFGDAALVTINSAPAAVPTTVEAEAVLLAEFGSLTDELTLRCIGDDGAVSGAGVYFGDQRESGGRAAGHIQIRADDIAGAAHGGRNATPSGGCCQGNKRGVVGNGFHERGVVGGAGPVVGDDLRISNVAARGYRIGRSCIRDAEVGGGDYVGDVGSGVIRQIDFAAAAYERRIGFGGRSGLRDVGGDRDRRIKAVRRENRRSRRSSQSAMQ